MAENIRAQKKNLIEAPMSSKNILHNLCLSATFARAKKKKQTKIQP
jgi:hypothetical protein